MAYSKLRGARKPKKKDEEVVNIAEHDAFQEQGMRIIDKVLAHPYFIFGTVAVVIAVVMIGAFVSSKVKSGKDTLAYEYASAVEVFESETGPSTEYADDSQKYKKAVELFSKVITDQEGTLNAAASLIYTGKAYRSMNDCGKAVEFFKKAQSNRKLGEDLLFGAYEGEAFCYFDNNEFEKAAGVWKEWLNKNTALYKDWALYYAGLSYEKSGKTDESVVYYKRIKDEYSKSMLVAKIIDKLPSENSEKAVQPKENSN